MPSYSSPASIEKMPLFMEEFTGSSRLHTLPGLFSIDAVFYSSPASIEKMPLFMEEFETLFA